MTTGCFIGNFVVDYTSESHWVRALEENGVTMTPIQVDDAVRSPELVMEIAKARDVCFYTRTHAPNRFLDISWSDRWAELEATGVRTVGIHLDRYFDLEREFLVTGDTPDAQFTMGTVFTADGGSQSRFEAAGVNHRWFRPGVDRVEALVDAPHLPDLTDKIVFTGSGGNYHGEYAPRGRLLAFLHDRYGSRFVHYGHGGDRPVVRQGDLNAVLQSAAVVIGDSCFANSGGWRTDTRRYVSDRLYETIGRGGFLLFPQLPDMIEDFGIEHHEHCATYIPGDWPYLGHRIDYYLSDPDRRRMIAERGRAHVLANHTYTHRMADLLAEVGLGVEESSASSGAAIR